MRADEDDIREQIDFCDDLMSRFVYDYKCKSFRLDSDEKTKCKLLPFKQDIVRLRRELLQLSKMVEYKFSKM